jgi:hypothetical protein
LQGILRAMDNVLQEELPVSYLRFEALDTARDRRTGESQVAKDRLEVLNPSRPFDAKALANADQASPGKPSDEYSHKG